MAHYLRDLNWFSAVRAYQFPGCEFEWTSCAYCGMPATDTEHVIPRSLVSSLSDMEQVLPTRLALVPSCRECNVLAGDRVFKTIADKRKHIQGKLRKRYKAILRIPPWRSENMEGLSQELQRYIQHGIRLQEIIRARLAWPRVGRQRATGVSEPAAAYAEVSP